MILSPELLQRPEQRSNFSTEVLDSLSVVHEACYGLESTDAFIQSIVQEIIQNPNDNHLLIAAGDSGNGKSITSQEVMAEVIYNQKRLQEFLRKSSYSIACAKFPWGDAKTPHVELGNHIDDPSLYESKLDETWYREQNLYLGTHSWASAHVGRRAIKLGYVDIPLLTGMFPDTFSIHHGDSRNPSNRYDEIVGVPRGEAFLRDIFDKSGSFSNQKLNVHFFGISASPDILNYATENRRIATQENVAIQEIVTQLRARGFDPGTEDEEAIRDYFNEVASPDQMRLVQNDIDTVIAKLIQLGVFEDPKERDINLFSELPHFQFLRHRFIVQELFPYFMEKIGIPEKRSIIFANETLQEQVHAYLAIAQEKPLFISR